MTTEQKERQWVSTTSIQVIEARGLTSKDPNGASDPYCLVGEASPSSGEFIDLNQCTRSEVIFLLLFPQ